MKLQLLLVILLMTACTAQTNTTQEDADTQDTVPDEMSTTDSTPDTPTDTTDDTMQGGPEAVLLDELSTHSTSSDCWVVFEGNVYDLTAFLPQHPGGVDAIAPHCGTTAFEDAFIAKHGRSKVQVMMGAATLIGTYSASS